MKAIGARCWPIQMFVLWLAMCVTSQARAQDAPVSEDAGFVQFSAGLAVVREQPNFGGYFCCDAGGVAPELLVEAGGVVAPWFSLRGELALPAGETDHLSAPRFIQENSHRDVTLSALAGFHRQRGPVRPVLLAGAGVAFSRTTRISQLLDFRQAPPRPFPNSENVMQFNETLFVLTFGADVPCAVSRHVSIVPTLRVRLLLRSSESRTQDGLGRWLISPGVGLRVGF